MSQLGYILLAVGILVALLVTFVVSFVLYKRTPVPKGCEDIQINEENCGACSKHNECALYKGKEGR